MDCAVCMTRLATARCTVFATDPHILDAAELGLEAWKKVSPETIKSCWRNCDILPPAVHADLDQDVGKNIRNKKKSLEELTDLVQRLSLEAKKTTVDENLGEALQGLGLAPGATPTRASMEAVQTWLGVGDYCRFGGRSL
ncbi:unnamed protein product [Pylaiella littoralis]